LGYLQINKRHRAIAERTENETAIAAIGALQNATTGGLGVAVATNGLA